MKKTYKSEDVDKWIEENNEYESSRLLSERLPKVVAKLNKVDKRIIEVLSEIRKVFPDAQYYTASGGFNLVLGRTHDGLKCEPQNQRTAWGGSASIGDGDW